MSLKNAIGYSIQGQVYRQGAQLLIYGVLGYYLFKGKVFRENLNEPFTSKEALNSRVILNLAGLALTFVLGTYFLSDN